MQQQHQQGARAPQQGAPHEYKSSAPADWVAEKQFQHDQHKRMNEEGMEDVEMDEEETCSLCASAANTCSSGLLQRCFSRWGKRTTVEIKILKESPWQQKVFVVVAVLQVVYLLAQLFWDLECTERKGSEDSGGELLIQDVRLLVIHMVVLSPTALYFAIDAILTDNTSELFAFLFMSLLLPARVISFELVDGQQDCPEGADVAGFVLAVFTGVFNIVYFALLCNTYRDLRLKRFYSLGADPKTRELYRLHEKFDSIKKLDAVMVLLIMATLIFFEASASDDRDQATRLTIIILLFLTEIPFAVVGSQAVARSDPYRTYLFWAIAIFLPVFVVTFGSEAASDSAHFNEFKENSRGEVDVGRYATMVVIGSVSIIVRASTVMFSVLLYFKYGTPQYRKMLKLVQEGVFKYKRYLKTRRPSSKSGDDIGGKFVGELSRSSTRESRTPSDASRGESFYEDVERFRDMENTMRAQSFVAPPSSMEDDVIENPLRANSYSKEENGYSEVNTDVHNQRINSSHSSTQEAIQDSGYGHDSVSRATSNHTTSGGSGRNKRSKRPQYDARAKAKNFENFAAELEE
eukprot:gb/GECG01001645.1/.p1 GENE.gb/GECG01001645.1/~~gb/GECG01001645.1/.p1  ORF type:complete len:576 (+),score=79.39 gb/GECG01001645.1/:1-1728(+)